MCDFLFNRIKEATPVLLGLGVALVFSICGAGCSSKTNASVAASNETPRWNWETYPAVPRMRLAALPCQLMPKSSIAIHSPLNGVLRVYVSQPRTNLQANLIWGEFEPEIFAAEAQELEEAGKKLDERERWQLDLELPKQRLKLQQDVEEAQRQLKILTLLSTNKELAHAALSPAGQKGTLLKADAVENARAQLKLLQQNLDYLEKTNSVALGIDLPGQRSDWQRRKLEFERRQAQARMRMPFDGQLTLNLPLTDGVEEYPVSVGQEIAVARDLSLVRVRVSLSNPAWLGLPTDRLCAVVRLPTGDEIEAPFAFQKIEKIQTREEAVFYFQFPTEASALASRLLGADVGCELWLTLPQKARIVPKLSLIMNQPSAFQGRSWVQGVQTAWPGARVLVEGQTDLAVVVPSLAKQ